MINRCKETYTKRSWCSGDEFALPWQCNSFISCFSDTKCVRATGSSDMLEASSFSVKESAASSITSSAVEAPSTGDARGGPSGVPGLRHSAHKKPSVAVAGQPKNVGGVAGAGPVGVAMISEDTGRQTKYLPKSALHPTAGTNRSEEKKDVELFAITHMKKSRNQKQTSN